MNRSLDLTKKNNQYDKSNNITRAKIIHLYKSILGKFADRLRANSNHELMSKSSNLNDSDINGPSHSGPHSDTFQLIGLIFGKKIIKSGVTKAHAQMQMALIEPEY